MRRYDVVIPAACKAVAFGLCRFDSCYRHETPKKGISLMDTISEHYCVHCDHPTSEHDDNGKCHALDLPDIAHVNDCSCVGLLSGILR